MYLALILLLRAIPKRQVGQVSVNELLVIGVIAGVARNALAADAYSLTDCLGVVATILGTSYLVTWLSYKSHLIHAATHHQPVVLIRDGRILHDHLRAELMTEEKLRSKLRGHGSAIRPRWSRPASRATARCRSSSGRSRNTN